jgi:Ca-activated chloride channel family protein
MPKGPPVTLRSAAKCPPAVSCKQTPMPVWLSSWLTSGTKAHLSFLAEISLSWPSFERPAWLLLIPPLIVASWWIARRSLAGWNLNRQTFHLVIRCLVITLLCATLAEPHARREAKDVAVVAVLDVSDSVPADQRHLADAFLTSSLSSRSPQDRFGLVTVARDAIVQSLPISSAPRAEVGATGQSDSSRLQKGIDLARTLLPADAAGRLLLLSDGNETTGSLATAARSLVAAGVPIDIATFQYDRSAAVRLNEVVVPSWVRDGDLVNARLVFDSGTTSRGRLSVLLNGEPVDLDPDSPLHSAEITLPPGKQVYSLPLQLPSGPFHRIEAVFEPENRAASIPQLLRAESVVFTSDRGRVLFLTENTQAAAPLIDAISSDNITVETREASTAPHTLAEWSGYDMVVLFDQPAYNFSQAQQEIMARYVHDTGGGLIVIGGPESLGAGGWIGSPLANALPVLLDPPQKRQMPLGALALVIDASGSMGAHVSGTGINQQQIANEAAILGVRALSRLDHVAILAFSDGTQTIVPLTPVADPERIARRIRSIGPMGGTNLFPAVDAAAAELAKSPAGVKHIVVLTDGQTYGDGNSANDIGAQLRRRGITLSTVAIGDQSNDPLLVHLARAAGGRYYNVTSQDSRSVLPQIFMKEAQTVRRTLIWEGAPFVPRIDLSATSMLGISGPLPGISGYVVTADRGGFASVPIRGPQNDPILAQWQHGLGRVTVYTSDAATRWNSAWAAWPTLAPFWTQQAKWAMRPTGDALARVSVDTSSDLARVSLDLFDAAGERLNFAAVRARVVQPPGADAESLSASDVTFRQTAPGRYEARVESSAIGTHLLTIQYAASASGGEQVTGGLRAAITRRSGDEFRSLTPATQLLTDLARQTNGRIHSLDPTGTDLWIRDSLTMPVISRSIWLLFALAAVACFLFDVAARRIMVDLDRIRTQVQALFGRRAVVGSGTLDGLAVAKARSGASIASTSDSHSRSQRSQPRPHTFDHSSLESTSSPGSAGPAPFSAPPKQKPTPTPGAAPPSDDLSPMARLRAAKARSLTQDKDNDDS